MIFSSESTAITHHYLSWKKGEIIFWPCSSGISSNHFRISKINVKYMIVLMIIRLILYFVFMFQALVILVVTIFVCSHSTQKEVMALEKSLKE